MARSRTGAQSRRLTWDRRTVLCAAVAAIVAGLTFADAAASVLWRSNPDAALVLWANDSRALTQSAENLVQSMQPRKLEEAAELSRRSLASAPLQVRALRVLGTTSELKRKGQLASAQLQLAGRLSRRDLKTQLWEIESAVQRDDISQVLRHYDIALKTKPDTQQLLFPLLASGIQDPAIRAKFIPYLRSSSTPWMLAFLIYAAERGDAPHALAALLVAQKQSVARWTDEISPKLLNRLLSTGDFDGAELYSRSLPAYSAGLERNAALQPATMATALRPFTWAPQDQSGAFARADSRGAALHIYADAQTTGEVLRRFMSLPPGRYTFSTSQRFNSAGPGATARWNIKCLRGGHFLDHWASRDPVITGRTHISEEIVLPRDCQHQYITLTVNGGVEAVPLEYDLTSIEIRRVS